MAKKLTSLLHRFILWLRGHRPIPKKFYGLDTFDTPEPVVVSLSSEPAELLDPPRLTSFAGSISVPRTRAEANTLYGYPGDADKPDLAWQRKNMVMATGLPGDWGKGRLYVHRLAEAHLREALKRCEEAGVLDYIDKLGCYNHRRIRFSKNGALSYHSYGVAIDINPGQNQAWSRVAEGALGLDHERRRGRVPRPFKPGWKLCWPNGMPAELVEAFESAGWTWGGRWEHFVDAMHFELVG